MGGKSQKAFLLMVRDRSMSEASSNGKSEKFFASFFQKRSALTSSSPDLAMRLKAVLRGMPGPVAIITTRDMETGQPAGLAASAVIPVSMAPPSMLVCVNRAASAHSVIEASGRFCINLIGAPQTALVEAFSGSALRDRRFVAGDWGERHGLPHLPAAPASLFCLVRTTLLFGTHEAFIGEVFDMTANGKEPPIAWLEGAFAQFKPLNTDPQQSADQNGTSP